MKWYTVLHMKLQKWQLILVPLLVFFCVPKPGNASTYNPHNIITDEMMQNYQSMTLEEITQFLNEQDGYISKHIFDNLHGKKRSAAQIVYNAAHAHKINPKYILVTLQKEQSLIEDKTVTARQLDLATGYAVCDSCKDNDPRVLANKGFGKQVDAAAGIIRWYYDHVGTEMWIKQAHQTYNIDSIEIIPENNATAFLYTYTPHIHGNKNFYNLWQRYFGTSGYPDNTLVRAHNDSKVYLIQNGKRRYIKTMTALLTRYDPKHIISVKQSEIEKYPEGTPINLPNYAILKETKASGTEKYYLVDYDTVRPFESKTVIQKFGFHPDEIIDVKRSDIEDYQLGEVITVEDRYPQGRLLRIVENDQLYFVKKGSFHSIAHPAVARVRFPHLATESGTIADIADLEDRGLLLFPDAALLGNKLNGKIYLIENGKRRHITDETVFLGLGYTWDMVTWTDPTTVQFHQVGEPVYLPSAMEGDQSIVSPDETVEPEKPTEDLTSTPSEPTNPPEELSEANKKELEFIPLNAPPPHDFPETGKMIRTPASHTSFVGKKIDTPFDAYLVADYDTEQILAGKNIDVVRPIASLTKILTAYRLYKEDMSPSKSAVYIPELHRAAYHGYRIAPGERVRNRDLMRAMLITSRNTPTRMMIHTVDQNEQAFIDRMNATVASWGLHKTTFADSYGYDLRNQSTAREYLNILIRGLADERILTDLELYEFEYEEVIDKDGAPYHHGTHTNKLIISDTPLFSILASKTGYLHEAGHNLVMLVERVSDGKKFYIITLGNPTFDKWQTEAGNVTNWAMKTF